MAFERIGGLFNKLYDNMNRLGNPNTKSKLAPEGLPDGKEGPPEATDYEDMMQEFGQHWSQDKEGLENIMNQVSHHESKGKNVYQTGGGPGAGLFQYETGTGQGGVTARNRLAKWYESKGKQTPSWLNQEDMDNQGFDATKLDDEQQKMLFMADKRYHPTASLTPESTGDMGKWWAKNHWAGGAEGSDVYNTRVASFNRDNPGGGGDPVNDVMANYNKQNSGFTGV